MIMDDPDPPSFAISVRVRNAAWDDADFQQKHDLREGRSLNYVDQDRAEINSVLMAPPPPDVLRQVCEERRKARETKRAMRSDSAIASHLLITFGKGAQPIFEALPVAVQDDAMQAVAARIARELGSTVVGLVVHRDESAHHGHVTMPAVALDGRPMSRIVNRSVAAQMQDWAAEEISAFAPSIVRGKPKADRIADGEPRHRIVHRSVRELHNDLPRELQEARERVSEMTARVDALKDRAELSDREAKRLLAYTRRLEERQRELAETEGRLDVLRIKAKEAASRRAEDNVASFEAISIAVQEAGRIVSEAQNQAAIIRAEAREDAASIRSADREDVRLMAAEVYQMGLRMEAMARASQELEVKRSGKHLVRRFADFLARVDAWLGGSATWAQLSSPPPPETSPSEPDFSSSPGPS